MDGSVAPTSPKGDGHRVELVLGCAALYGVVGTLALWVRGGNSPLRIDRAVSRIVGSAHVGNLVARAHARTLWPTGLGHSLVSLGLPVAGIGLSAGLAALALARRDVRAAVLCLVGPALAVFMTDSVLKPLVDRHNGAALAYPSGHATGAAAVAALTLVLFHRWRGWRAMAWFAPIAFTLPAVMGLALVRLGFHYPTDVIGGTAMGAATVVGLAVLLNAQYEAGAAVPSTHEGA